VRDQTDGGLPAHPPGQGDRLAELCAAVSGGDPRSARLSTVRQLTQARPAGSLGRLDEVVHRVAAIRRTATSGPLPSVVSVLAGDHGVAAHGVSAHRHGLTGRVLRLIASGQAPVNIVAARVPASVECADFGLLEPVGEQRYKVAAGTGDICREDAMSPSQAHEAMSNGAAYAADRLASPSMLAVGEIGVGNTTAAAALACRLTGVPATKMVGAGSGVDEATVARKRQLIEQALSRTSRVPDDPMRILAALGGFEIAGNVGVILAAAGRGQVVVIDGAITAIAALIAVRLCPAVSGALIAAHCSTEPAHQATLHALGQQPLLDLGMRLGMASGAALALNLINSALAVAHLMPSATAVGLAVAT
jgi:nicotinate-nucleotide--dimethylbenzimidazole phosphoribosyltransferase